MAARYQTCKAVLRDHNSRIRQDIEWSESINFISSITIMQFPHHFTMLYLQFLHFPAFLNTCSNNSKEQYDKEANWED